MAYKGDQGTGSTLIIIAITLLLLVLALLFGCEQKKNFYSVEHECLMVEQDNGSFNCYSNPALLSVHEGYHIEHAKEHFHAHRMETIKKMKIADSLDESSIYRSPKKRHKNFFKKRIIKQRNSQDQTQNNAN